MEYVTSPQELHDLFTQACLRNLPLEMFIADVAGSRRAKSRFLQIDTKDGAHTLLMDMPSAFRGRRIASATEIEVQFQVSKEFYLFKTQVLDQTQFELTPGQNLDAIRLKMPDKLGLRRKRAHVRIFPDAAKPVHIRFRVLQGEPGDTAIESKLPVREGNVRDLSVGGVGLFVSRNQGPPAQIGSLILTEFSLPEEAALYAIIRNVREIPEHRAIVYGTQFIRTRDSENARNSVAIVDRYVRTREAELNGDKA